MTGSIVWVSALFPSTAWTISGNPAWSVSSPMAICGSRRRSLENPGSRNPSPASVSKYKVLTSKAQARRAQPGMCGAGRGDLLPPVFPGIYRKAPLHGPVRRRRDSGLLQRPQRIQLADWLVDPGQHQVPEHLIAASGPVKAKDPRGPLQRIEQAVRPRCGNRQRARVVEPASTLDTVRVLTEIGVVSPHRVTFMRCFKAERPFRMTKSDLAARPVFHRLEDSIQAHLTIVFAALAVSREAQARTGLSINRFSRSSGPCAQPLSPSAPSR